MKWSRTSAETPWRLALKLALGHADKLSLKSDFAQARERGRKLTSQLMVALIAEDSEPELPRCGVVCGRKFSLRAVDRNRARRLLWESFRLLKPDILPCQMILIPRRRILDCKMQDALRQLKRLLKDAGRLKPDMDTGRVA